RRATEMVEDLGAGRWPEAEALWDPTLLSRLLQRHSYKSLAEVWAHVVSMAGPVRSVIPVGVQRMRGVEVAELDCAFEAGRVPVRGGPDRGPVRAIDPFCYARVRGAC